MRLYPAFGAAVMTASLDVEAVTVKAAIVKNTVGYSSSDAVLDDLGAGVDLDTVTLTNVTVSSSGVVDADSPVLFLSVTTGETAGAIVVYYDSGLGSTSTLIARESLTPWVTGSTIVRWSFPDGLFQLPGGDA